MTVKVIQCDHKKRIDGYWSELKRTLLEPAEKIKPVEEEVEKPETPEHVEIKANDEYTESLKRRLRLLDLKIEREEILNQLAAI